MNIKYRAGLALATLMTVTVLIGCSGEAAYPEPPPPEVSVATVEIHQVHQWQAYNGRVEAAESVSLRPRVSGYIESVNYVEGSEVNKGDILFVIDQRTYRATHQRAQAELRQARTQAELARSELARAEQLAERRLISNEELDQRRAALERAEAEVAAVRAALDITALELEFTEVRAPVSGRAGRALVTEGNLVSTQPNATVLTIIVSTDPMHVYFEADEASYLAFQAAGKGNGTRNGGNPVQVGLVGEDGFPHTGVMDFMDNQVDPATGTIRARAVVPNADQRLTPGLFARVRLMDHGTSEALLIDDRAILTDQDRKYVYIVDEQNLAQRRDIRTGRALDGMRVVLNGLSPGERVIVNGMQKVFFPGMPVQPQPVADNTRPQLAAH